MHNKPRAIIKLATRCTDKYGANHHIYCNNGTYWIYYHAHYSDRTGKRERHSLKTKDVDEARRRRDYLFAQIQAFLDQSMPTYTRTPEIGQASHEHLVAA
jgi:hypothetical protein